MRKLIELMIVSALLSFGQVASADPYEDGFAAYKQRDYATALKLLRPLAEQGNAGAQNILGVMYEIGRGVPQDDKEAVKWFRLSAEQGDAGAQNSLGLMYDKGQGVPQDNVRAYMWMNLAAASLSGVGAKTATDNRNRIAAKMTPAQIEQAEAEAKAKAKALGGALQQTLQPPVQDKPAQQQSNVQGVAVLTQQEALGLWSDAFYGVVLYDVIKCKITGSNPSSLQQIRDAEKRHRQVAGPLVTRAREEAIRTKAEADSSLIKSLGRDGETTLERGGNCQTASKGYEKIAVQIADAEVRQTARAAVTTQPSEPLQTEKATAPTTTAARIAPSFDCSKATTPTDRTICSDADLVELDLKAAALYQELRKDSGAERALAIMREGNAAKMQCRDSKDCIRASYNAAIAELGKLNAQSTPAAPTERDQAGSSLTKAPSGADDQADATIQSSGATRQDTSNRKPNLSWTGDKLFTLAAIILVTLYGLAITRRAVIFYDRADAAWTIGIVFVPIVGFFAAVNLLPTGLACDRNQITGSDTQILFQSLTNLGGCLYDRGVYSPILMVAITVLLFFTGIIKLCVNTFRYNQNFVVAAFVLALKILSLLWIAVAGALWLFLLAFGIGSALEDKRPAFEQIKGAIVLVLILGLLGWFIRVLINGYKVEERRELLAARADAR